MVRCKDCGNPMELAPKRLEKGEVSFPFMMFLVALDLLVTTVGRLRCPEGHCIAWSVPVVDGRDGFYDFVQSVPAN